MDKKTQKKVSVLRQRVQKLQKTLAGVKMQTDEPDEVERIEQELTQTKSEIANLLGS